MSCSSSEDEKASDFDGNRSSLSNDEIDSDAISKKGIPSLISYRSFDSVGCGSDFDNEYTSDELQKDKDDTKPPDVVLTEKWVKLELKLRTKRE
ncbi:Hypothetical predicted protein [Mytilus galloprovincialis]|uniref:Uncharacterized protein n=1 Tax=Mytilus galloprovincialis TaxID=29158 RepID=A0A8B6F5J6_MYTGA|nr:Hypothetical predicted protein [Mytilus galloprovincialis]